MPVLAGSHRSAAEADFTLVMSFNMRRRLFLLLVNLLPGFTAVARAEVNRAVDESVERETLDALVDTIVPADEAPGALDIGLGEVMVQEVDAGSSLGRALTACTIEADRLATERHDMPFSRLEQAAREELVLVMLGESVESNGQRRGAVAAVTRRCPAGA